MSTVKFPEKPFSNISHHRNLQNEIATLYGRDIAKEARRIEMTRIKIQCRAANLDFLKGLNWYPYEPKPIYSPELQLTHPNWLLVLMMVPDSESKRRLKMSTAKFPEKPYSNISHRRNLQNETFNLTRRRWNMHQCIWKGTPIIGTYGGRDTILQIGRASCRERVSSVV